MLLKLGHCEVTVAVLMEGAAVSGVGAQDDLLDLLFGKGRVLHLWLQDVLQLSRCEGKVSKFDIAKEDFRLAGHPRHLRVLVLDRESLTIDDLL